MTEFYKITSNLPLPTRKKQRTGSLVKLIFDLQPGESFLCPHQASSSLRLVKRTNPERRYEQHSDKETGGTRIWRIE